MSLYQSSVLKHYLKLQDSDAITKAYKKYTKYFLNPTIQDNIRSSKEEEYQGIFLTELFVNILDYTLKPKANYNLVAEYKNENNARKADGAILDNDIALGVIELKGTNTKDLESIRKQAFDYKANQKGCVYVITSNFEKLRFYINDATEFEEFNLFQLTPEQFALLYICLHKDNILNNLPLKIKEASVVEEEQITKQFYKDYSIFKRELYRDLVRRNAKTLKNNRHSELVSESHHTEEEKAELIKLEKNVKLTLFKKSQKLIDRYLFIFFAEDRGLLPPNSTQQILNHWKSNVDFGNDTPLYDLFKQYFKFLDQGRAGTANRAEIYAYNGGLFKEDTILDSLDIDSEFLYKHTSKLAAYDFESQVDVNILGHIFENSLNEIESVNAEIEGADFDKQKSKRKKDGVFYTPKYITKYIVENTVGKLCEEKKAQLGFKEEEYFKGRKVNGKKRPDSTIKKLVEILDSYRDWLLQLTICDPACGSGAFLNQALNFLIAEHHYIDELKTKVLGGGLQFPDIENTILENNIYGVDLNEESVEIAKLSLWLRTAQPRRKLNDLSSNIKCGNSLIDSKTVAGDKAFNWQEQFPKVFEKGGFDVVIGNPPYVRKQGLMEHYPIMCEYYEKKYQSATANYDIYALFMEKCYSLINSKGVVSFILPHKFLVADFGVGIRQFFKDNTAVENLVHFGSEIVFEEASTYTCIIDLTKTEKEKIKFKKLLPKQIFEPFVWDTMSYNNLQYANWDLQSEQILDLIIKLKKQPYKIENVFSKIFVGMQTSLDAVYVFEGVEKGGLIEAYNVKYDFKFQIEKELVRPFIKGNEISKYKSLQNKHYVLFPYEKDGTSLVQESYIKENLPKTYSYLKHFEKDIRGREKGKMDVVDGWYSYIYQKNHEKFPLPKIMTQEISLGCNMTYDENGEFYHPTTIYSFVKNDKFKVDDKYYLGILNSKVMWFFLKNTGTELRGGYFRFKTNYLKPFPLPEISGNSQEIIDKVNLQLENNKSFQKYNAKFIKYLISQFQLEKLSKKLENCYELDFADFIKELNKAIKKAGGVPLTKKDEFEWLDLFEENKQKAQDLQNQINQTDAEINAMVYELYGLTDEEIKIVENS
ncbi:BREX-1 system adenine-specific DNA-methyltransferase PglX [Flavobacteriaceae bacterium GSB9]|nr:BREX-1 system adenine-specific DNA-methyltransferase PglX [Flavobacteriaceae bacterium GSB9]